MKRLSIIYLDYLNMIKHYISKIVHYGMFDSEPNSYEQVMFYSMLVSNLFNDMIFELFLDKCIINHNVDGTIIVQNNKGTQLVFIISSMFEFKNIDLFDSIKTDYLTVEKGEKDGDFHEYRFSFDLIKCYNSQQPND